MKKLLFIIIFSIVFTNSLFAVRKYTKVTINGESAKMCNDEDCYTDYRKLYYDGTFYNGVYHYKYDCIVESMNYEEIEYYSKKTFTTSKVEFKNRTEFFMFTRNDGAKKITFYKSEIYDQIVARKIASAGAAFLAGSSERPQSY